MDLVKDPITVITKDGEATIRDEIKVKVTSVKPVEQIISIGGIKAQIDAVNSEIVRLQKCIEDLQIKKSVLLTVLTRLETTTQDIQLAVKETPIEEGKL